MAVSSQVAAALAAKYPRCAAEAAGAVALGVEEQVRIVNGTVTPVNRYQKYRMPSGQVLVLDESLPAVPAQKVGHAAAEVAAKASAKAEAAVVPEAPPVPAAEAKAEEATETQTHGNRRR